MRYLELLLEYNQQALINTYKAKVDARIKQDHSINGDINNFISEIETPLRRDNKLQIIGPYMKWILGNYASDNIRFFEDIPSKVIPDLLKYDALKRKNKLQPDQKDINQLKPDALSELVDSFEEVKSKQEETKEEELAFYKSGEAELIFNNDEIKVVIPKTKEASCYFGTNTKWCTAAKNDNTYFNQYNNQGPLYIVLIKKENKRYQFHFPTEQFMDEKDRAISPFVLGEFYPILWDIFSPIAEKNNSLYFNKNPSEKLQLKAVGLNPSMIKYFNNPSEILQIKAVSNAGRIIRYIKNPSEKVQLVAVRENGYAIEHIKNPSEEVQLAAVKDRSEVLEYIKNPSEAVQLAAIKNHIPSFCWIKNPSEKVQLFVVKKDGYYITDIKNPSEAVQLAAVKSYPDCIENIKNPSEVIQFAAIKQTPWAISYIENPSEKMQLIAVTRNGKTINSIKNPSEKVQLAAVRNNGDALLWIDNPSEKVQIAAVKQNSHLIKDIEDPSEEVQLAAVRQNPKLIKYIKKPTKKVRLLATKKVRLLAARKNKK